MRPRSALFAGQVGAAAAIGRLRELAVLADIGFGKTAATLTGLRDAGALPALVVAPARVAERVWHVEAAEWEHLADLVVTPLGTGDERRRILVGQPQADVETISYEALVGQPDLRKNPWTGLTDEVRLEDRYQAIVFDELARMKAPGTQRFRRLRAHAEGIRTRVGLTGSPVPNHLLDLWGEMFMVAGAKPLGRTYSDYKLRYFEPVDYLQRQWRLKGMTEGGDHTPASAALEREIFTRVAPWCFAPPPAPPGTIPPVRVNEVDVPMPAALERKQAQLVKELYTILDSGTELEAIQASTLAIKLRQFASGAVYTDKQGTWEELHGAKVAALDEVLGELQGEPALVFYWYRHEAERVSAMLHRTGRTHALADEPGAIDRWCARKLEVLLAHPQSAAAGLNLQAGGHHAVWFTLSWAGWHWSQGNGRLARTGQRAPLVTATVLLCGPADRRVLASLRRKADAEVALFASLRLDDLM